MVGRIFARLMMAAIMVVTLWLASLTWQSGLTFGQKAALMIIEGTIFLSNLSLLIQSVMSFGSISIREDSILYFLGGYAFLSERFGATQLNAHYCFLSWARSFALALSAVVIFFVSAGLYSMVLVLVTFLSDPYSLTFSLKESVVPFGFAILVGAYVIAAMKVLILFSNKLSNRNIVVKWILSSLLISVFLGILIGSVLFVTSDRESLGWLSMTAIATGMAVAVFLVGGAIVGLSYCIMWLVKSVSEKYSTLGKVWNTLCPVQTINVVR